MPTRVILGAVLGVLLGCVEGSAQVTLELAQSHVFPAPARTWETAGLSRYGDIDLHLVGNREALTIFELGSLAESSAVSMHVTNEERGSDDVEIALSPPSQIPGTYGDDNAGSAMDGEPYSTTAWTGTIPADLIKKGLSIKVTYPGGERTWSNFTVGAPTDFGIVSLPFYFFGADPETTPLTSHAHPAILAEIRSRSRSVSHRALGAREEPPPGPPRGGSQDPRREGGRRVERVRLGTHRVTGTCRHDSETRRVGFEKVRWEIRCRDDICCE